MTETAELTTLTHRTVMRHRAVANFLADHEETIEFLSYEKQSEDNDDDDTVTYAQFYSSPGWINFSVHGPDAKRFALKLRRTFGGKWEKRTYGETFTMFHVYDKNLTVEIEVDRDQVCEKKVTGTTTVQRRDPAVVEALRAAMEAQIDALPLVAVEEDVIDYDCGSLAG